MKPGTELATQEPSVAHMLSTALASGITTENASALEKMMQLYERMEDKRAEKEFAADMIALQLSMPSITANATVPNDDGSERYRFAQIDHIDGILRPVALNHGFTYSFSEAGNDPARVTKICTVMHKGGHSKSVNFTVRVGKGPPKSSEAQGDGAAATYAQRRALCDAFGIVVDKDSDGADARNVGAFVTQEKAIELMDRVKACGADPVKFLAFAQANTFAEIGESMLPAIEAMLRAKEKGKPDLSLAKEDLFK